jgi:hypothetical protein
VDLKPYQGEINVVKLNQWLQQLEVYFNVHSIRENKNISFNPLKLENNAQTWWEINTEIVHWRVIHQ